jgi:hypothetical protein
MNKYEETITKEFKMAINKAILEFLKKHKYNGKTIEFVARMDSTDKTSVTDIEDSISIAFLSKNYKDIATLIEAIFDDGTDGAVSQMKGSKSNEFVYTLKNESETISYDLDKRNHTIIFEKGNKKVALELSTKATDITQWKDIKVQLAEQLNKSKNMGDFITIIKNIEKTMK